MIPARLCLRDPAEAWADFTGWRVNYERSAYAVGGATGPRRLAGVTALMPLAAALRYGGQDAERRARAGEGRPGRDRQLVRR